MDLELSWFGYQRGHTADKRQTWPCRQSLHGELIERRGKGKEETGLWGQEWWRRRKRETEECRERKIKRKKREIGGVSPFKGAGYCLPSIHGVV